MSDVMKIELKSSRTGETYQAGIYKKEMPDGREDYVILHKSLKRIYMGLGDKKPDVKMEAFDVSKWPGIPPLYAMKCTMGKIDAIGELTGVEWETALHCSNLIKAYNPIAIASNRAFDKAFIQYMQFMVYMEGKCLEGGIYSTSEMSDMSNLIPLNGDNDILLDGRNVPPVFMGQADMLSVQNVAPAAPVYQAAPATFQGMDPAGNIPQALPNTVQAAGGIRQGVPVPQPTAVRMDHLPPQGTANTGFPPVKEMTKPPVKQMTGTPQQAYQQAGAPQQAQEPVNVQPQGQMPWQQAQAAPGQAPAVPAGPNARQTGPSSYQVNVNQGQQGTYHAASSRQKKRPAVMSVEFDHSLNAVRVSTNDGIYHFDPLSGRWDGKDAETVDIPYLKEEAEKAIHQSLETFCGIGM